MKLGPAKLVVVLALGLTATLVFPGTSIGETSKFKAAGSVGSFHWQPSSRTIVKGDKVVWKNPTSAQHTVTAYGKGWSKDTTIASGERTSFKFRKAGTFKFRCKFHSTLSNGECSGMCGTVVSKS